MANESAASQDLECPVTQYSWGDMYNAAGQLWQRQKDEKWEYLYGIPRGGCLAALLVQSLAHRDGAHVTILDKPHSPHNTLIVDDIVDSGKTAEQYTKHGYVVDSLYRSINAPALYNHSMLAHGWVTFPWERGEQEGTGAEDSIIRLLQYMGEDPKRDGLKDTPARVLKAWKELTAGYDQDPKQILSRCFEQPHDEMVVLRGVEFHSTCEHHLLPFYGVAAVGYIPGQKVVGISKLARVVDCFARRLQIQERLTQQIANAVTDALQPLGVGVVVRAKHSCMGCRGVLKPDSDMVTSVTRGALRHDARARAEFMALVTL